MCNQWLKCLCDWIGLNISYHVKLQEEGDIDVGWAARQLGDYDTLLDIGCLSATVWWGWYHYSGEDAIECLQQLGERDGYFLAYANAVVTADGQQYDNPESVPADAGIESVVFTGREPLPFFNR